MDYSKTMEWIFARDRLKGKQLRTANMLVEDHLPPAAIRPGVRLEAGERSGFHTRGTA
jgi:hypothetical protein